jgi:hypothetical protein
MKRTLLILACILPFLLPAVARADTPLSDVYLLGPGGVGGSITTTSTTGALPVIGTSAGGLNTWDAQSFQIAAGKLSQITIPFGATTGAPTGTVTYEVDSNNISIPGTALTSGTFTPTANANNIINTAPANIFLNDNTTYWVFLRSTTVQAANNFWTIKADISSTYANGNRAFATDGTGNQWSILLTHDLQMTITTVPSSSVLATLNDKLAQSITVSQATIISGFSLYLKKFNSPAGTLTARLETDAGNMPSGSLAIAAATATLAESSVTTSYTAIPFVFSGNVELKPGIEYWIVLSTNRVVATDYISWGSSGLCGLSYFRNHNSTAWQMEPTLGVFALTIVSFPAELSSSDFVTLNSGTVGAVDYRLSAGEAALFGLGIILLIVALFGVYQLNQVKK